MVPTMGADGNDHEEGKGSIDAEDPIAISAIEAKDDEVPSQEQGQAGGVDVDDNHNHNKNNKRSINDHYGHKIGFWQTLSLLLNAGLMIFAQVGTSGIVLSSLDPAIIAAPLAVAVNASDGGECNDEADLAIWKESGGNVSLPVQTDYCSRVGQGGCLANTTCLEECFQTRQGYSVACSSCFGAILPCGISVGCTFICLADGTSDECEECLLPCADVFYGCAGLPQEAYGNRTEDDSTIDAVLATDTCNNYDMDAITDWYAVYTITYAKSIADAWNGGAKFLAIVVVLFSGIWPYVKNIILVMVWYIPMTAKTQTSVLTWLSRLSKYTLVDVFVFIGVMVGVQLQLNVGGVEVVTRAEPRFGIIAFFLATAWEFFQIELIKVMHERMISEGGDGEFNNSQDRGEEKNKLLFSQLWIPVLFLLGAIPLYIAGAMMEFLSIESSNGSGGTCLKSYNLVSVGNALINEVSMAGNSAPGQTWFLYIIYVLLVLALPILTHILQIVFIAARSQSTTLKTLIKWASAISCFACVEVLLIGIFAVESKFEGFVQSIAGEENADLFDVKGGLGSGFYVLIPYCFVASFLQFSLMVR